MDLKEIIFTYLYSMEKPILLILGFILTLSSCSNSNNSDRSEKPDHSIEKNGKSVPHADFINLTKEIEPMNWIWDTARLTEVKIYSEIERSSVQFFNGMAFYPISFEKTTVAHTYKMQMQDDGSYNPEDFSVLESVNMIWGYFYQKKDAEAMKSDGLIEEWNFENEETAKRALAIMEERGDFIFFNTQPYFSTVENRLYIFHTRAMAFSYDQKEVFDKFSDQ